MMKLTVSSSGEGQRKNAMIRSVKRTSGLEAPIVALSGAHGVSFLSYNSLAVILTLREMVEDKLIEGWAGRVRLRLASLTRRDGD